MIHDVKDFFMKNINFFHLQKFFYIVEKFGRIIKKL
jgi:hypothetical protein